MIRFVLAAGFIGTFLILSIPVLLIEWVLGLFAPHVKEVSSLAIVLWAFRVVLWITGVTVTVIGEENVPSDTPVLYVGNHASNFDILLTYIRVPRLTGYIAKKEFLKIPLLSNWMRNLHCLFLDRENIKAGIKTIRKSIDKMKAGISICIFPEGTRNRHPDTFLPFHDGSFKIAEKSDCPVLPMSINNSSAMFEKQYPRIKKAHVVLEYGKPFYMKDLDPEDRKQIGSFVQAKILKMYDNNKKLV